MCSCHHHQTVSDCLFKRLNYLEEWYKRVDRMEFKSTPGHGGTSTWSSSIPAATARHVPSKRASQKVFACTIIALIAAVGHAPKISCASATATNYGGQDLLSTSVAVDTLTATSPAVPDTDFSYNDASHATPAATATATATASNPATATATAPQSRLPWRVWPKQRRATAPPFQVPRQSYGTTSAVRSSATVSKRRSTSPPPGPGVGNTTNTAQNASETTTGSGNNTSLLDAVLTRCKSELRYPSTSLGSNPQMITAAESGPLTAPAAQRWGASASGQPWGNGEYYVSGSAAAASQWTQPEPGNNPVWAMFDHDGDSHVSFSEDARYDQGDGTFMMNDGGQGSEYTLDRVYYGDWAYVRLPVAIFPTRITLTAARAASASNSTAQNLSASECSQSAPGEFRVFGSNDGIAWTVLFDQTREVVAYDDLCRAHLNITQGFYITSSSSSSSSSSRCMCGCVCVCVYGCVHVHICMHI